MKKVLTLGGTCDVDVAAKESDHTLDPEAVALSELLFNACAHERDWPGKIIGSHKGGSIIQAIQLLVPRLQHHLRGTFGWFDWDNVLDESGGGLS
ncbi:unnamed protein product, partial [marine sediment metagenome]